MGAFGGWLVAAGQDLEVVGVGHGVAFQRVHGAVELLDGAVEPVAAVPRWPLGRLVVGGVAGVAAEFGVRVGAVVGIADDDVRERLPLIAIADAYGIERATREPLWCIERAARDLIQSFA